MPEVTERTVRDQFRNLDASLGFDNNYCRRCVEVGEAIEGLGFRLTGGYYHQGEQGLIYQDEHFAVFVSFIGTDDLDGYQLPMTRGKSLDA